MPRVDGETRGGDRHIGKGGMYMKEWSLLAGGFREIREVTKGRKMKWITT